MESTKQTTKEKPFLPRLARFFTWIVATLIFLIVLIIILIQLPAVQNYARKKVVSYLENKLKTKVEIGKLTIKFSTSVSFQKVYFEDQSKDTLLYGGEIKVGINMFRLLRKDFQINEITLNNIVAKVKRLPPDSVFNFQYIINAFAGGQKKESQNQNTATLKVNIKRIVVNNIRIIYKDAFTGDDMDIALGHLDTKIATFDPAHLLFNIPSIKLKGLAGYYYELKPLQKSIEKSVAEASAKPGNYLQLINKEINLSDINVVYKSEPLNLNSSFVINDLVLHPKTIDLKNSIITLHDATLNNSKIEIETASKKIKQEPTDTVLHVAATPSFKIISGEITIHKSSLKYDDQSIPSIPKGMDYSHLNFTDLSLKLSNLKYSIDSTSASVKTATLKEKSGFILDDLRADFQMNLTGISLQNLLIKTPGSEIKNSVLLTYTSLEEIVKDPGLLGLDIDIQNSKMTIKDLLTFVPQLNAQASSLSPNSTLYVDTKMTGKVNDMNFRKLILKGLSATDINATGIIKGMPNPNKLYVDISINKFKSSKKDVLSLLPKNALPHNITLPESLSASGKLKGSINNLYTDLAINTSLGDAKINGIIADITDQNKARYDLTAKAINLQLGTIMQNPKLGLLTGDFKVKGNGFKPETANATFNGVIENVTLNNYNYINIKADGSIANKFYKINASVHDPNLDATMAANGEFSGTYPNVKLKATIDSIKTLPLNLTSNPVIYHGQIEGDFTNTDPDNLAGNLLVTHSILVNNGKRIIIDSLVAQADNNPENKSLSIKTNSLYASIKGQYKLTQLPDVFHQSIEPYFSVTNKKNTAKVDPYRFNINAGISNSDILRSFLPELKQLKPVTINGNFSSDSSWNLVLKSPYINYGTYVFEDLNFTADLKNSALEFNTSFKKFESGTTISVYATSLIGTFKNNNLDFKLNIKDQKLVDKYNLRGLLSQPSANNYSFSLNPENLLLNYNKWDIIADNSIQYFNKNLTAHNFVLSKGTQQLSMNSTSSGGNSPLQIDFKNFKIETLTGFIQSDTLIVNGLLNGNAVVKNIQTQPTFTTDLTISDLSIYKDTLGILSAKVNNNVANMYHADVALNGRGNELHFNGDYLVKPNNSSYDFMVDIKALQMKSIEAFTKGNIKNARGFLFGKIALKGDLNNPGIDGNIHFNNAAFNLSTLNNVFLIDKEAAVIINKKGIELNKFTLYDTAKNSLVIDGAVNTPDFFNYSFDLSIKADNFQAINSTKKDNQLFYGKMVFSTRLTVKGTPSHPIVDGDLTINDKTDFTILLPQNEPGVQSREGVVRFVDYSAKAEDSLFMAPYDSLNISPLTGYDVSVNINIKKDAVFNLIVDAANGDFLKLKGLGQLTGGIDASGKVTLVGSYEIDEGSYDLSFNFIKRKFIVQKGSRIVWTGEPTTAQIDVNAIYIANTAPLDLVLGQTVGDPNIYKQKLPFEVHLSLKGELLKPLITFDIILPGEKNYNVSNDIISTVQNKLTQIRQDPGEMNKQVFALLLLNRFVSENPFDNSSGGTLDVNAFAMQSVSKLLAAQLNSLTQGLIEGVDINFDLASTQDYTTGSKQTRTDFNVAISKRLLSDRLTVTVGNNFELQGPGATNQQQNNLAGNISINYKLSKDGKYMLRAYRKTDYTGAIEGYVIETGIGFIITVDYNKFKELFTNKEQRKKKRDIMKQDKVVTKDSAAQKADGQTNTPLLKIN